MRKKPADVAEVCIETWFSDSYCLCMRNNCYYFLYLHGSRNICSPCDKSSSCQILSPNPIVSRKYSHLFQSYILLFYLCGKNYIFFPLQKPNLLDWNKLLITFQSNRMIETIRFDWWPTQQQALSSLIVVGCAIVFSQRRRQTEMFIIKHKFALCCIFIPFFCYIFFFSPTCAFEEEKMLLLKKSTRATACTAC